MCNRTCTHPPTAFEIWLDSPKWILILAFMLNFYALMIDISPPANCAPHLDPFQHDLRFPLCHSDSIPAEACGNETVLHDTAECMLKTCMRQIHSGLIEQNKFCPKNNLNCSWIPRGELSELIFDFVVIYHNDTYIKKEWMWKLKLLKALDCYYLPVSIDSFLSLIQKKLTGFIRRS